MLENYHAYILTTMSVVTDMEAECQLIFSLCIYCEEQTLEGGNKDICYIHVPRILTHSIPHRPK